MAWLSRDCASSWRSARRHGRRLWMDARERIRTTPWRPVERVFTDGSSQPRFLRETVFGRRRPGSPRLAPLLPAHHRSRAPTTREHLAADDQPARHDRAVGRQHLRRTHAGPAYGFKHATDELGWADGRLTEAVSSEGWWEVVLCAYLLV